MPFTTTPDEWLHTGTLELPGIAAVAATGKRVQIPEQFFFYRVRDNLIVEIVHDHCTRSPRFLCGRSAVRAGHIGDSAQQ